jgi:hypothetical protein
MGTDTISPKNGDRLHFAVVAKWLSVPIFLTSLSPSFPLFLVCLLSVSVQAQQKRRVSAPISFYDDAEISMPGVLNVSEYFSYTKVPAGRDLSFPSTYLALGLNRRVGVEGSFSYASSQFEESRINALGDSSVAVKLLVFPEGKRRPALALNPMLEVLGDASIADNPLAPGRVNYVLPLVFQKSFDYYRIYSMAGYLTRGIVFDSTVFELNCWSRVTPLVIVSGSRLTHELKLISDLGLNRSRVDVTSGVAVALKPGVALFVNTGRSLGRMDLNSTSYQVTFGLSFNVRLWGEK